MTLVTENEVLRDLETRSTNLGSGDIDELANGSESTVEPTVDTPTNEQLIKVLKGNPSDAEIAALVAVLSAAAASTSAAPESTRPVELWGHPTSLHRGVSPFSPYAYPQLSHLRD
ncbi:acyl-CoA carboxylase subunit epsilon [Antrihabitans spumae]|uniref:Acyl-CoA carboxylase subunit epsilon n=1 Tax=Antrihabitans spumae TaxID=3373370 RepID=A0ABW7KU12_9NOCA